MDHCVCDGVVPCPEDGGIEPVLGLGLGELVLGLDEVLGVISEGAVLELGLVAPLAGLGLEEPVVELVELAPEPMLEEVVSLAEPCVTPSATSVG